MNFLHPEFLWLAPLIAAPIVIHLLSRMRYRRVRWAAIEFLLRTERRAVRRARLQQILLMALRTLLLAAALMAMAQPVFRGGVGRLLGGDARVVALIDASASMSSGKAAGSAFERSKRLVADAFDAFPDRARAMAAVFARDCESPFREPLRDIEAAATFVRSAEITGGSGDVPGAVRAAAGALRTSGGGGAIWLLTDRQAADWRVNDAGAWDTARQALKAADSPRIIVTNMGADIRANFSFAGVRFFPPVPVEGDTPKLTATVVMNGVGEGTAHVSLFFDGRRVDSQTVRFDEPGKQDCVFHLPAVQEGVRAGYLELSPDALPADNRRYFVVDAGESIPLLIVEGVRSPRAFEGSGSLLALAAQPPVLTGAQRTAFQVKKIAADALDVEALDDYAAVFLADVPQLSPAARASLARYAARGGLVVVFPGPHTVADDWTGPAFPALAMQPEVEADADAAIKVVWVSLKDPLTRTLPVEGLDRVSIRRLLPIEPGPKDETLATTDSGHVFLVRRQVGKGRLYCFAVSAQVDMSNLPFTPIFLPTTHRLVEQHLVDRGAGMTRTAFEELRISLRDAPPNLRLPDGRVAPLQPLEDEADRAVFSGTAQTGIYRLTQAPPGSRVEGEAAGAGQIVAAVNTPEDESTLERVSHDTIRELLRGSSVSFMAPDERAERASSWETDVSTASSFPLAAAAMLFLLAAVLLAWRIGRPATDNRET